MGSVRVIRPGLQTTVQDLGRWGCQSQGVPVAGAMDPFAHRVANALAGNRKNAATLEIMLTGPELAFEDDRVVAVAGAEFHIDVDGHSMRYHRAFKVGAGSVLKFGGRRSGARAYLAIAGGVDVPPILGSRSTHVPSRMGGIAGRSLLAGDYVPLGSVSHGRPKGLRYRNGDTTAVAQAFRPAVDAVEPARVRVLPGPHIDRFTDDALRVLQAAPYVVQPNSDRMGFRLRGAALRHVRGADIISDVTPLGTLQVPASGQPILLMADRQTTGGYAKLATVITADIGIAAQTAPGASLTFEVCTLADAMAALIAQERSLLALEAAVP